MTNERCELRHRLQEDGNGRVPVGKREDGLREDGSEKGAKGMLVAW